MTSDPTADSPRPTEPRDAFSRLVRWLLDRAERPGGVLILVVLAVLEATLFPAPTEAMLLALAIARPRFAWWLGAVAAASSAAGGVIGYQMGLALYDAAARPLLEARGLLDQIDALARLYRENAFLALASSGYTPIPYMLYTMAAGALEVPFGTFVGGSLVGRSLKYAPLAALAYFLGPAARRVVERHAGWVALAVMVVLLVALLLR